MEEKPQAKGIVCVTGATGHLGTWLVMRLLDRGYRVRAAVEDLDRQEEIAVLRDLPGASDRLEIVKGNLFDQHDLDAAVDGCDGVFHLACPTDFIVDDPQKDLIDPSVQGTLNVLQACSKSPSIKRVVHTSSAAAVRFPGREVPGQVLDESCWTDVEMCLQEKFFGWAYFVAKTVAEQKAYEFARKNRMDVVSILPTLVTGPFLINRMPNSVRDALSLVRGDEARYAFIKRISCVHIEDVIGAHIFVYENPAAEGRYVCSGVDASIGEVANLLSERYPEFNIATEFENLGDIEKHYCDSSKLKKLGFEFGYTLQDMFDSTIKTCKEKGLL